VTKRQVVIGDYIEEGSSLFEVIDLTQVWVMFDAYESDLPWIKFGDTIHFTLHSLPGKEYQGNVRYVDPMINKNTRVAKVRVEIANPQLILKPGMFVNGVLESKITANSKELLVPKSAILWTGKRAIVYIKLPNRETPTFIHREITLGYEAGDYYVVAQGLSEGEIVAANGVFKIDASAQLAGKSSMMSPSESGEISAAQSAEMKNLEQREFKVFGACVMCKDRIEKTAKAITGVFKAEWNQSTKMCTVSFDKSTTSLEKIHKAIARVGHDTELYKADDDVYHKLPQCCLYRSTK
jgi:Cu(I)/Ag(I) efflux system membrane fusion protein